LGFATTALFVYRTRTGGAAETDLQTPAGVGQTQVTPDPTNGAVAFLGPDEYRGSLWVADPAGTRWEIPPAGLANRPVVSGLIVNGQPVQRGEVSISTAAQLDDLTDVDTAGGLTGYVLTRLSDGTYGLAPRGDGSGSGDATGVYVDTSAGLVGPNVQTALQDLYDRLAALPDQYAPKTIN
jgi:hypothetical protein